ncbi:hypothetical protein AOB60_23965 [Streptomyces noursei]|uniref:Uncharacterized protein n=1 Tax=Streptomyces noursei TaxID=1971 RepID=A0A2N8P8N5_STRNR|nr:hypothetical protein AOB60_23965 [Streptomyces noursei]
MSDDDLVIAHDQRLSTVEAHLTVEAQLHQDVSLARVVQTCGGCPSQWDAWTTKGQYPYLRYRHGEGTVEQPSTSADGLFRSPRTAPRHALRRHAPVHGPRRGRDPNVSRLDAAAPRTRRGHPPPASGIPGCRR